MAALESGVIGADTPYTDGGSFSLGGGDSRCHNAGGAAYGTLALRARAAGLERRVLLPPRCRAERQPGDGQQLQKWAFRLGHRPHDRHRPARRGARACCRRKQWRDHQFKLRQKNPKLSLVDRPWSVGDNINLAIGQGDVQANPLQMAVAYAAIANGGYVVKPAPRAARRGLRAGARSRSSATPARRDGAINATSTARRSSTGSRRPPSAERHLVPRLRRGSSSRSRSPARPAPRSGAGKADQSWYVALAPYPNPRYVVARDLENGGFGADTAAPAAKQIIGTLFNVKVKNGGRPDLAGVNTNG